jgi:hypothetical protein
LGFEGGKVVVKERIKTFLDKLNTGIFEKKKKLRQRGVQKCR